MAHFFKKNTNLLSKQELSIGSVCVVQLAKQSLPASEDQGSEPVIRNFLSNILFYRLLLNCLLNILFYRCVDSITEQIYHTYPG